jgi:pyruvate/2-oxoglutarate dehydrogenase complex dihydrolipoamide acyltransferase (E2) component
MATKSQYRLFAKIAPDPQRPSQQVRVRFNPQQPEAEPILVMLERTPFGETRTVVAQALRIGAAAKLGEEPLSPPPPTRKKPFGSRRFVSVKREEQSLRSREDLYTIYDPRQAWNRHLEAIVSRCEWGETNKTLLQMLIDGLRAMGYTSNTSSASQAAAAQPTPASPAAAVEPAAPPATPARPARQQPASVTIGVDPTQVQPRPASPAVNSLIRGAGRRPDQG